MICVSQYAELTLSCLSKKLEITWYRCQNSDFFTAQYSGLFGKHTADICYEWFLSIVSFLANVRAIAPPTYAGNGQYRRQDKKEIDQIAPNLSDPNKSYWDFICYSYSLERTTEFAN